MELAAERSAGWCSPRRRRGFTRGGVDGYHVPHRATSTAATSAAVGTPSGELQGSEREAYPTLEAGRARDRGDDRSGPPSGGAGGSS